ncbi:hypothetical protein GLOIN_2v744250 [Rhizophagus clarus]|uniref:F-box domain-containing protein n=1 Tax=Rhizophagus clarus TaxID=94130 RepID=A0A8H3QVI2_9GLOM|nr:hypothetical protein GLOIN_2v744250 [Rhizophagus clarus]
MHIVTLLERLPPELIPFIVKNLSNQDLKNFRSINDTWAKEIDLEWFKRKTLFDFSTMSLVQGENTVKDFYSKLEECNKSFGHSEEFLKCALLKGLSTENAFKVRLDGLEELATNSKNLHVKRYKACRSMWKFSQLSCENFLRNRKKWPILLTSAWQTLVRNAIPTIREEMARRNIEVPNNIKLRVEDPRGPEKVLELDDRISKYFNIDHISSSYIPSS